MDSAHCERARARLALVARTTDARQLVSHDDVKKQFLL